MSHMKTKAAILLALVVALGVFFVATRAPSAVSAAPAPQTQPTPEIPFFQLWAASGHNDAKAAAFTHWDTSETKTVEVACAKCHSGTGFQDFVGADKSAAGKVDKAPAIGSTITCTTCHNTATLSLTSVTFPSGAEVKGLGREAVCMTCHQGTTSGKSVEDALAKLKPATEDTVMPNTAKSPAPANGITFSNIHYFAAATSRYGTLAKGGYEYAGKQYDALFDHVSTVNTCQDCHNPHSLELNTATCATCHTGATTVDGVRKIRMASSLVDYDGDGNTTEPIRDEIAGVQAITMKAIQTYATEVAKTPIAYSADSYPYFFNDTNKNGKVDTDEAKVPNAYNSWTPRLVKAAFNYQMSIKDPGAYAHGGKYIIELLYDSTADLNSQLTTKIDMTKMARIDSGHFAGSEMAFRDWDAEGEVPGTCSRCHSAEGLPQFIANNANVAMPVSNGLMCETCHNDLTKFTRYEVNTVPFPSGAKLSFGDKNDANLCLECHQGRESTVSVNKAVAGMDPDKSVDTLSFRNVHYFAADATMFGTSAQGMYEYKDQKYLGQFKHVANFDTCVGCHDSHTGLVKTNDCKTCHQTTDVTAIRMPTSPADYDGDGNKTEGIKGEIDTMRDTLNAALVKYAKDKLQKNIVYGPDSYPYFFTDTNANGKLDADEAKAANSFKGWSPRLLEAAYNLQYSVKDTGLFAHNAKYVIQVLYDSIKDVGGDVSKMTRP